MLGAQGLLRMSARAGVVRDYGLSNYQEERKYVDNWVFYAVM